MSLMKQRLLLPLALVLLVAFLVAGCAGAGEAANGGQAATPVKVLDATPTPGGPAGAENVAGTPMAGGQDSQNGGAGSTAGENAASAASLDTRTWERHRFHDEWEFGYPSGWQVDRPGEGNVVLSGSVEGGRFLVDIARVLDPTAVIPEEWVNGEITRLNGEGQGNLTIADTEVAGDSAKRVSGLLLADVPGVRTEQYGIRTECPADRTYVWDKGDGGNGLLVITAVQNGDEGECNPELLRRLMDNVLGEVRR